MAPIGNDDARMPKNFKEDDPLRNTKLLSDEAFYDKIDKSMNYKGVSGRDCLRV